MKIFKTYESYLDNKSKINLLTEVEYGLQDLLKSMHLHWEKMSVPKYGKYIVRCDGPTYTELAEALKELGFDVFKSEGDFKVVATKIKGEERAILDMTMVSPGAGPDKIELSKVLGGKAHIILDIVPVKA
jgi:hypothetical protein